MFIRYHPRKRRFIVDDRYVSIASRLSTRWLLRAILQTKPFAKGRLLDVGCGEKPYGQLFGASEHIGVDMPWSLHGTKNVDVFANALSLPFMDNTFDTVLCTEVLEHLPEPYSAVGEAARVLKSGGHLILSVPFIHWINESPYDFYRFTEFGILDLLNRYGFRVIKMITHGGLLTVLVDIYARIASIYLRRILTKLYVPSPILRLILYLLIGLPQHVAASCLFFTYDHLPRIASFLDSSERLTLGYVVVAEKV